MNKQVIFDVLVIGGGPAGMMAAGRAAERGLRVLLLEKNNTLGKKLLITGGGRCNVTNNKPDVRTILARYKKAEQFLFSAFSQFAVKETIAFFALRGVLFKEENEGRLFPESNTAKSIFDVLVAYMKKGNVSVRTNSAVVSVAKNKNGESFVVSLSDGSMFYARACIVATGGTSHPETGSTGDGFAWLQKMGHAILKPDVSLVPIALSDMWVKNCSGVVLPDVKLTTFKNNVKQKSYKGRILFTHFGISGPTVLNMSRDVGDLLERGEGFSYSQMNSKNSLSQTKVVKNEVMIALDLFPALDVVALRKKVQALLVTESNKKIKNTLPAIVPPLLVSPILFLANIDPETPNHSVRSEERRALVSVLKKIELHVKDLLGKDKAIISSGGVALTEVDFKTMQSRLVSGLYLVGDVLNIDRPSGGYGLQLCWTTGFVAGKWC